MEADETVARVDVVELHHRLGLCGDSCAVPEDHLLLVRLQVDPRDVGQEPGADHGSDQLAMPIPRARVHEEGLEGRPVAPLVGMMRRHGLTDHVQDLSLEALHLVQQIVAQQVPVAEVVGLGAAPVARGLEQVQDLRRQQLIAAAPSRYSQPRLLRPGVGDEGIFEFPPTHDRQHRPQAAEHGRKEKHLCKPRLHVHLAELLAQGKKFLLLVGRPEPSERLERNFDLRQGRRIQSLGQNLLAVSDLESKCAQADLVERNDRHVRVHLILHPRELAASEETVAYALAHAPSSTLPLLHVGLGGPGDSERGDLSVRIVGHPLGPAGVDDEDAVVEGDGGLSDVGRQHYLPLVVGDRPEDFLLLLRGDVGVQPEDDEARVPDDEGMRQEHLVRGKNLLPAGKEAEDRSPAGVLVNVQDEFGEHVVVDEVHVRHRGYRSKLVLIQPLVPQLPYRLAILERGPCSCPVPL
mmetsp:Transcript_49193/g.154415  ORF Transcript_49193/g.154415 Transcript_49193/m.154415 type:complete len:465 (+) Transcript_49193:650-2044(+)